MIKNTPSKWAIVAVTAWWAFIALLPGNTFASTSFAPLMSVCRHEWVVGAVVATLLAGLVADFRGWLPNRMRRLVWSAAMVWWFFVALSLAFVKWNGTGPGAYLVFAGIAGAAWWQRKDEMSNG